MEIVTQIRPMAAHPDTLRNDSNDDRTRPCVPGHAPSEMSPGCVRRFFVNGGTPMYKPIKAAENMKPGPNVDIFGFSMVELQVHALSRRNRRLLARAGHGVCAFMPM
jgi:hypothetical protein